MNISRGDRHLRNDPHGALGAPPIQATAIARVRIEQDYARTAAGQHLLYMLANLLCRQFGILARIQLVIPSAIPVVVVVPFGVGETLSEKLADCCRLIASEEIDIQLEDSKEAVDFEIVLGPCVEVGTARHLLFAQGEGWRFAVSASALSIDTVANGDVSIGPYLAAWLVAGEVFKRVRGLRGDCFISAVFGSAWSMSMRGSWGELDDGPAAFARLDSHVYFAGAGAVAQAAALTLTASRIRGTASAIDYDALDETNENRYLLTHTNPAERDKAKVLANHLRAHGIDCQPHSRTWQAHAQLRGTGNPNTALASAEHGLKFPIVLSCVDKNAARHSVQAYTPAILLGGSTDGLSAKASIFDRVDAGRACLACHNPIEDRNRLVEERTTELRGMTTTEQEAFAREHGFDSDLIGRVLRSAARCGELSPVDLERFANPAPEMSVGFVSAAAGTLLCAQLLRRLVLGTDATVRGDQVTLSFRNGRLGTLRTARDHACVHHDALHDEWNHRWQPSARGANTS